MRLSLATAAAAAVIPAVWAGDEACPCIVTAYASLSAAARSCSNIVLSNLAAPPSSAIDLQELQTGAVVTFAGNTSFGTTRNHNFVPIIISGTDITITGAQGHVIDGNGSAYWDGLGSNGGSAKPNSFIVIRKSANVTVTNLNIKNWPVHCFSITASQGVTLSNLTLDNSDGDSPNDASCGKPAAHNTDGFGIGSSDGVTVDSIRVHNQDDCVAVTSGTNVVVRNAYCYGGHGLSVGSVGGKNNNTVAGVTFRDSVVVNSSNGCRIKTNAGTTGSVADVLYQNITLRNITRYAIDLQQDYLNGGPTGSPTNGVLVGNVSFVDVTGTAAGEDAYNYYILCGTGSCSDIALTGTNITGGGMGGRTNFPCTGCPS